MWKTYKQVYDEVMHIGSALRASGAQHVSVCNVKGLVFFNLFLLKCCVLNVLLCNFNYRAHELEFMDQIVLSGLWQWRFPFLYNVLTFLYLFIFSFLLYMIVFYYNS